MSLRLGDYRLTATLATDPFGSLHRAVRVEAGTFGRHALVRRFEPGLLARGLRDRLGEALAVSLRAGEARGLAPHCRLYHRAAEPWIAYDLEPGLSLADLLRACRAQGIPMGLDHVLTVLRDLAGVLERLQARGVTHGLLVPALVWVSYDGGVTLLDTAVAGPLRAVLPDPPPPGLEALAWAPAEGPARDLHLLACLGWQMLTLAEAVPPGPEPMLEALDRGSSGAEPALPAPLVALFARMVGAGPAFGDLEAFQAASGEALRTEEHGPSTFSLAFLVHTVLRERIAEEQRALEAERAATWTVSRAVPILPSPVPAPAARRRGWAVPAGLLVLAGLGVGAALLGRSGDRETASLRRALAEAQRQQAEADRARADLDATLAQEAERKRRLERELAEARDAARLEAIRKDLEGTQARQQALQVRQLQVRAQAEAAEQQARRLQAKAAVPLLPAPAPVATAASQPPPPPIPTPAPIRTPPAATPSPVRSPGDAAEPRLLQAAPLRLPAGVRPEGRLRLRVFVDEQGRALRATVLEGGSGAAAEAAVDAALRSTYAPARRGEGTARGWVEVAF